MNGDWIFVAVLVIVALAAGYGIGLARGRTLGRRSGRSEAWHEYTRQVGHAPPAAPSPSSSGPAQASVEDADFRVQD